jgi:hypothetical protein
MLTGTNRRANRADVMQSYLYKQGPLETDRQFAERIVREFHEYQAKQNTARSKSG